MPLLILPVSPSDAPTLAHIYLSAFQNPLSYALFPRPNPHLGPWWAATNLVEMQNPSARYLKIVDTEIPLPSPRAAAVVHEMARTDCKVEETETEVGRNGVGVIDPRIIAYAKWNVPTLATGELNTLGREDTAMRKWPEGADVRRCEEFFGELAKWEKEIMGERPHYHLELIATLPAHQGRGAASQLIRWGLEHADEEGLEAYVEAAPEGPRRLYERFGWAALGAFTLEGLEGIYEECLMLRKGRMKGDREGGMGKEN